MSKEGYKLGFEDYEIDDLLQRVKDKTVYDEATVDTPGLMSAEDKVAVDSIGEQRALSNMEIEKLLSDVS